MKTSGLLGQPNTGPLSSTYVGINYQNTMVRHSGGVADWSCNPEPAAYMHVYKAGRSVSQVSFGVKHAETKIPRILEEDIL
jgi:hypothetical protein